jgi:GxxExxY protein
LSFLEEELSRAVIQAFFRVYDRLGYGFLESVYVAALVYELTKAGYTVQREAPVQVVYDGVVLGTYRADILVERRLILEVKTDTGLSAAPERQLRNYLRCSGIEVGILLVFGLKPRFKRLIHTRDRKGNSN